MAYVRRLPSGKYQATVRKPDGSRITRTDPLKRVVEAWAKQAEADLSRGAWRDPRLLRMTLGEWHEKWLRARHVEEETARGDAAVWRTHVAELASRPLGEITRNEVMAWLKRRQQEGAGDQARRRALNYLRSLMQAALLEGMILVNPCQGIKAGAPSPAKVEWFTTEEAAAILEALDEPHRSMAELMMWTGLRWGECAALRVRDVDWLRRRVTVVQAVTQSGRIKGYPKTSASRREVPAPGEVLERLSAHAEGKGRDDLLFTTRRRSPKTGEYAPLSGSNWRKTWEDGLKDAGVEYRSPHVCRHTAASWLVQAGVPLYDVQRQLGHSSFSVTQRYAHLAPNAHDAVEGAWERIARDASATHGAS